jgi:DNA-binding NtrC family response regulator
MTRKRNILVVDDEPNVLLTYRLILQQQGYAVSAALSSEEARKAIRNEDIDLLLCDLSLEKQESGFDVIDFAKQKDPTMPTVLLTGYATPEATEHAEELAIPILFKPIDIKELLDTISGLLKENHEHKADGEDGSKDQGRKKRGAKIATHRDDSRSRTGA